MSKLTVAFPHLVRTFLNAAGNLVAAAVPQLAPFEIEFTNWIVAEFTPTGTAANIDYVNGTSSGVSGLVVDKSSNTGGTGGKFFILTAHRKPGTTAAILANTVIVSINSVEVARLYIEGVTGNCGVFFTAVPGTVEDVRYSLSGSGTTGDLIFALTQADPSIVLHLEHGNND